MRDYIASIEAGRNITDAHRSPEVIAERKAKSQANLVYGILFAVAVAVGNSLGIAGFVGVFIVAIVFAIGHDLGAKK
jgi:hypothetical protein